MSLNCNFLFFLFWLICLLFCEKNIFELERGRGRKIFTGNAEGKNITIKSWKRTLPLRVDTYLFNISARKSDCMNLTWCSQVLHMVLLKIQFRSFCMCSISLITGLQKKLEKFSGLKKPSGFHSELGFIVIYG